MKDFLHSNKAPMGGLYSIFFYLQICVVTSFVLCISINTVKKVYCCHISFHVELCQTVLLDYILAFCVLMLMSLDIDISMDYIKIQLLVLLL